MSEEETDVRFLSFAPSIQRPVRAREITKIPCNIQHHEAAKGEPITLLEIEALSARLSTSTVTSVANATADIATAVGKERETGKERGHEKRDTIENNSTGRRKEDNLGGIDIDEIIDEPEEDAVHASEEEPFDESIYSDGPIKIKIGYKIVYVGAINLSRGCFFSNFKTFAQWEDPKIAWMQKFRPALIQGIETIISTSNQHTPTVDCNPRADFRSLNLFDPGMYTSSRLCSCTSSRLCSPSHCRSTRDQ
jgi:hypothetical protein